MGRASCALTKHIPSIRLAHCLTARIFLRHAHVSSFLTPQQSTSILSQVETHDCANESTRCGAKSYATLRDAACGFSLITLLVLLARWFRLESSELSERSCKPSTSRTVWRLVQR